jgi:2-dehydro-3-deoxyphosphogluconate aldolase / (4S)-4-hydroxy-2-oxoglutarate aldolase
MSPAQIRDALQAAGVAAVIRTSGPAEALTTSRALIRAGIGVIEITFTVPDAAEVIRELSSEKQAVIGAGTVTTPDQFDAAIAAGARFVVAPVHPPFLLTAGEEADVLAVPGCATPNEVWGALRAGALAIKLFPISRLGGPDYLRDLAGPLPDLHIMPSGGIGIEEVSAYRSAGAWCVAVGGPLSGAMSEADRKVRAQRAAELGGTAPG